MRSRKEVNRPIWRENEVLQMLSTPSRIAIAPIPLRYGCEEESEDRAHLVPQPGGCTNSAGIGVGCGCEKEESEIRAIYPRTIVAFDVVRSTRRSSMRGVGQESREVKRPMMKGTMGSNSEMSPWKVQT